MFGKLKDKLKGWFKSSSEKIEEEAEVVETEEKLKKEELTKKQKEKITKKADKIIEKAKEEPSQQVQTKSSSEEETIKEDVKKAEKKQETEKELEEIEKQIVKEKEEIEEIEEDIKEKIEEIPQKVPETVKEAAEQSKELRKVTEEIEKAIEEKEEKKEIIEELKETPSKSEQSLEEEKPEEKKSFFSKIKSSLAYKITEEEFNSIFDDLEMLLLENNVALEAVEDIKLKLSEKLIDKEIQKSELETEIKNELKNTLNELLIEPDDPLDIIKLKTEKPFVILFFGINGTGKTTSIAKVTHLLKKQNLSVVLAAGDTFRAASIEQISEHAEKLNVPLIKHDYNADPAAVGFDAIKYAKAHNMDVVLIDTAGRMHTKANLIEEIKKIERVTSPDLKMFVAESIAGNDATEQAKTFHEAIEIDGAILSKADIDEKGGTIISISHATSKPIFYLGTGQNYEDLKLFNKQEFIENLGLD
jgi:fused signal recognition particle receptor